LRPVARNLINGVSNEEWFNGGAAVAGKWIKFHFASPKIIDQASWYEDQGWPQGVWKWQGSNELIGLILGAYALVVKEHVIHSCCVRRCARSALLPQIRRSSVWMA
jgi:hypothetical protein